MKKLLIIPTLLLILSSCAQKSPKTIETETIEGCEYFYNPTYGPYGVYSHKGNCSNPIHSKLTLTIDTVIHINITKSKEELEEERLQRELDELTSKLDKATRELNHNLNILEQYER